MNVWRAPTGRRPHTVTVLERRDRAGIWLRWYADGKPRYRRATVATVRDAHGELVDRLVDEAKAEGVALSRQLREGTVSIGAAPALTLARGIKLAFSTRGCYQQDPATDPHTRECKRLIEELADQFRARSGRSEATDLLWSEITPGTVREVWHADYAT